MTTFAEPTPDGFVLPFDDAASQSVGMAPDEMPLASGDDVLSAYVGILAHLRRARPGTPIAFRADDLGALSRALGFDPVDVEARIASCYQTSRVREDASTRREHTVI
jgi:hypothetical protein